MTAYTDPVGHQVEQYFRLRQLEQQAAETNQTDTTTSGR